MVLEKRSGISYANGAQAGSALAETEPAPSHRLARLCAAAFEHAPYGILLLDGDTGAVFAANPSVVSMLISCADDLVGKPIWEAPLFRNLDISKEVVGLTRSRTSIQCHDLLVTSKTRPSWIAEISFHRYSTGLETVIQCNISDITTRKRTEIAKRRMHILQALRRMASRVAIELDESLPALGDARRILNKPLHQMTADLRRARARLTELSRELSTYGGESTIPRHAVDLNTVVNSMKSEIQPLLASGIALTLQLDAAPAVVCADEDGIRKIVRMLVAYAGTTMTDGGALTIQTTRVEECPSCPSPETTRRDWVCLAITGSGRSLDREAWARLFEPFQTPSPAVNDSVLGLAAVYGLVRQNAGHISVTGALQSGTSFHVYLPPAANDLSLVQSPSPLPPPAHTATTILVIEQKEGLRNIVRNLLARRGYTVAEAASEAEALEFLSRGKPIRLVIVDIAAFGLAAARIARQISEMQPPLKALFIVDVSSDAVPESGALPPGSAILEKPFRLEAMLAKLREVLGD
jgi:two-component system, cell cycle sensor histidine kinase and response regulator CckA